MIKPEKKRVTIEQILDASEGGFNIFKHEIGNFPISRAFKHPLRTDKNPSAAIVCRGGIWFLKDFAEEFKTMTAIQFIEKKYGLTLGEAINKLAIEYGVKEGIGEEYKPVDIKWKPPVIEESEISYIFEPTKWKKEHYEFWRGTDVTQKHCEAYNTFAVKSAFINRARIPIGVNEVVFCYFAEDIDKLKLYFPERKKKDRFRTNVPASYIWNLKKIVKCQKLIVIKSMKDLLCTTILHPCTVALQSENSSIITPGIADRINKIAKRIYLSMGSDKQGVETSTILSEKYKWQWVNPKKHLLDEGVNDAYSLIRAYGLEAWKSELKNKNII